MELSQFILANLDRILEEWDSFASTIAPESDRSRLRDDAEAILRTIAVDMATPQSGWEQAEKSKGRGPREEKDTPAEVHAADRLRLGFDQAQMVSEYRAHCVQITLVALSGNRCRLPVLRYPSIGCGANIPTDSQRRREKWVAKISDVPFQELSVAKIFAA